MRLVPVFILDGLQDALLVPVFILDELPDALQIFAQIVLKRIKCVSSIKIPTVILPLMKKHSYRLSVSFLSRFTLNFGWLHLDLFEEEILFKIPDVF